MYMHPTDVHPYIHVYTLAHTHAHLDVLVLLERGSTRSLYFLNKPGRATLSHGARERGAHADAGSAPATEAHLLFAALAVVAAVFCVVLCRAMSTLLGLMKRSSVSDGARS